MKRLVSAYGTEFMRLMMLAVAAGFLWPSSGFSQGAGFADGNRIYKALGITAPLPLSGRADEVIE
jgi:hypothetical protein